MDDDTPKVTSPRNPRDARDDGPARVVPGDAKDGDTKPVDATPVDATPVDATPADAKDERLGGAGTRVAEERPVAISRAHRLYLLLVALISLWHFGAIVAWMTPGGYLRNRMLSAANAYIHYTKSDQFWAMFAPEPLSVNRHLMIDAFVEGDPPGAPRRVDLTEPMVRSLHGFDFQRIGRTLKAHDRILDGGEAKYNYGFAAYTCNRLSKEFGRTVEKVTIVRRFSFIQLDERTFRSTYSPFKFENIGTYDCPH